MGKNIYDMLNDITIDINELSRENFNDLENKTFIKTFKKSINKKYNINIIKKEIK